MSIRINDLTVRFKNGVVAVNKASLEIPKGIYGLLGENGAGKTTLMRVLTTVLKQTEGMVSLDGILYNEGNYEKIQKKIGYLPQEIDLYPNLTVKECLVYMGGLSGVARNDLEQRITYYLEKTSLTEHQNKKMRQLSGGFPGHGHIDFIQFSTHEHGSEEIASKKDKNSLQHTTPIR